MKKYTEMTQQELRKEYESLQAEYLKYSTNPLKLNMARGKPSPAQLDLSMPMMDTLHIDSSLIAEDGTDCRNYGGLTGIPECKRIFAELMGVQSSNLIIYGNSSLNIMFDSVSRSYNHGVMGSTPWCKLPKVKWLCVAPGYDRHFKVTEYFGFELVSIPMLPTGPDMDLVEKYVNNDESVKGIWCVPKYSNPTGNSYSEETVKRLASLKPAAGDFRIYWDNAYAFHHLYDDRQDSVPEILSACAAAGNPDMVYEFASTSKITFSGSGVAVLAASEANIADIEKSMGVQTIGHDKINQLRHVRFFKDADGVRAHMRKHAALLRPKFEIVDRVLNEELGGLGIGSWTKPNGGYFVSFDALPGCAKAIVAAAKAAGVQLTGAGAAYPYGIDPEDKNIRIAPSYPTEDEIETAMKLFTLCVKKASAEQLLNKA